MGRAILGLTPDLFVEFAKAAKGNSPRRFSVKANALPEDAQIVEVRAGDIFSRNILLVLESSSFSDGVPCLLKSPVFETIYDADFCDVCEGPHDESEPHLAVYQ